MRTVSPNSDHWVTCKLRYDGQREWTLVSSWNIPDGGRLVREMRRSSYTTDVQHAQRWARKYKVACPVEPEPPRA